MQNVALIVAICIVAISCPVSAVPVRTDAQQRGGAQTRADEGGLNPYLPPAAPPAALEGVGSWQRGPRVHESEPVQFRVGLKQSGLEHLEATVLAVSDPSSQEYGRHLSLAQVRGGPGAGAASCWTNAADGARCKNSSPPRGKRSRR
jgi:hypothetical protein